MLDMGAPVRIADVARQLMEIAGRTTEIVYTGLRQGEKLHEELFGDGEVDRRPIHPSISHVEVPDARPGPGALACAAVLGVGGRRWSLLTGSGRSDAGCHERRRQELGGVPAGMIDTHPLERGFLPFALPTIDDDDVEEVVEVLRSGWLTSGPQIQKFEQEFSAEADAACARSRWAPGPPPCTSRSPRWSVPAGSAVITTPMTFCSTAHVIEQVGLPPAVRGRGAGHAQPRPGGRPPGARRGRARGRRDPARCTTRATRASSTSS